MTEESAVLEPQADADASPDDRFAEDKSVDTSVEITPETVEVEAETEEVVKEEESEADPSPADEQNVDEKSDTFQKRIDKLTTSFRESEREADALRTERDEALSKVSEALQKLADAVESEEATKTLADFEFNEDDYRQYIFDESARRAETAAKRIVQEARTAESTNKVVEEFSTREKAFADTVDDYMAATRDTGLKLSTDMRDALYKYDEGPEVAYYLAKHPDESLKIFKMDTLDTGVAIRDLTESIKAEKAKASKKVSDAPPPPPKIDSGDAGRVKKITDSDVSDAQFAKMRRKQIANR